MAEDEKEAAPEPARPSFALDFPRDAKLDALVETFQNGDFARVRQDAPHLIASSTDEAVKRSAATLLARTKPDPLATLLVVVSAVLLIVLSAWWIVHDGGH